MKRSFILALFFFAVTVNAQQEDFETFYKRFISDPEFQLTRVKFPSPVMILNLETAGEDTMYVSKDEWEFSNYEIGEPHKIIIYDNFDRKNSGKNKNTGERVVSFVGTNNGINYHIYFKLINGKWYLVKTIDLSA